MSLLDVGTKRIYVEGEFYAVPIFAGKQLLFWRVVCEYFKKPIILERGLVNLDFLYFFDPAPRNQLDRFGSPAAGVIVVLKIPEVLTSNLAPPLHKLVIRA